MKTGKWLIGILILMLLMVGGIVIAEENAVLMLPESLEVIREEAFLGDTSLKKVIVPEGVKGIGVRAFADSSLSEIELPGSLEIIANNAFEGCEDLLITAPVGSYAYEWAEEHFGMNDPAASPVEDFEYTIEDGAVTITKYIGKEQEVVIPAMIDEMPVLYIGSFAFSDYGIESVKIPASAVAISDFGFYDCYNLREIVIPYGVTSIGEYAFAECSNLVDIEIPNSVVSIGDYAFSNCWRLPSIIIPGSIESMGEYVFESCDNLKNAIILEGVTCLGRGLFSECLRLESVTIPQSVTTLDGATFEGCKNMKSITIPDNVTSMGMYTFANCANLKSVDLPEKLTDIDLYAFSGCCSLSDITLPPQTTAIGFGAFSGCENLKSITIPASVTSVSFAAFDDSLTTIYGIPGSYAEEWAADNGYEFLEWTGSAPTATPEPIVTPAPSVTPAPTVTPAGAAEWAVSYDSNYSTITVTASGTPDASKAYLFIAENAAGGHHSGTIDAGKTTASFTIKSLQMPRAAKYKLYVLPADAQLTDDTRGEYFIDDVVLPLWEGGMINAVRSGGIDVTSKEKLFVDDEIEIDWDGSFGVETTEISVTLNGAPVTIDAIKDKDGPETIRIDSKAIGAKAGDVLSVTITVTPPENEVSAQLVPVSDEWIGIYGMYTQKRALLIGAQAYQEGDLAEEPQKKNALAMTESLHSLGYVVMTDGTANGKTAIKEDIEMAFGGKTDENSISIIYIAAHGGNGILAIGGEAKEQLLTPDEFVKYVEDNINGTVVIILEACHSGSFMDEFISSEKLSNRCYFIGACDENDTSLYNASSDIPGWFTEGICNCIEQEDRIGIATMVRYATKLISDRFSDLPEANVIDYFNPALLWEYRTHRDKYPGSYEEEWLNVWEDMQKYATKYTSSYAPVYHNPNPEFTIN